MKRAPVITNPSAINQCFVRLADVNILGVDDVPESPLRVHVECARVVQGCPLCGVIARVKDRPQVELVDLSVYGHPTRLIWHKRRFVCPEALCPMGSWTEEDPRIASTRLQMTDRSGRWITEQVGRCARSVSEVAKELGCDWHTVNDAVLAYGQALVEEPDRFGSVFALGLDEVAFLREAPYYRTQFSTSIVDVGSAQLLDIVPGRSGKEPIAWLERQSEKWLSNIGYATLDLSGPYRAVFTKVLPNAVQVADPFHVVKLANAKIDECRRRIQNELFGHRGRKEDPLYRVRRLLTKAEERLSEDGREKLLGLLRAGDPKGHVATTWQAKELIRAIYCHENEALALEFITQLGKDFLESAPPEVRSLGRTLLKWKSQIVAWHQAHVTNGPTEAMNNLIKRVKRAAFGFRSFRNYRITSATSVFEATNTAAIRLFMNCFTSLGLFLKAFVITEITFSFSKNSWISPVFSMSAEVYW
jgi:transposase